MRIATIILLLLACGCKPTQQVTATQEKISKERQDSTVYIERLRIDTVTLKGDSVQVKVPVPCDSLKPITGKARSGRVNLHYAIKNGQLEIDCNADSLLVQVYKRDILLYRLGKQLDSTAKAKETVVTVTNTVTRYRTPFWNWVLMLALVAALFRKPIWNQVKKRLLWT